MKKVMLAVGFSLFVIGNLSSCKREDEPKAGKGGNATIVCNVMHHSKPINDAMVYIKYNAQDKSSTYDDSVKASGDYNNQKATFVSLKNGKYFLFSKGYDSSIAQTVEGGIPFTVTNDGVNNLTLPVTEAGH